MDFTTVNSTTHLSLAAITMTEPMMLESQRHHLMNTDE